MDSGYQLFGNEEYGRALDCLVKTCTDLLICDSDGADTKVLLGKRIVEPQPDWWFMGGRMKTGETPEESMARLVKREQQLVVEPSRFRVLGYHSYHWARRQQPPIENGTCDLSIVFTLTLEPGEAERIHMDDKEYSDFRWFTLEEILDSQADFHPALKQSARDIYSRSYWNQLKSVVDSGAATEEQICETAVRLVKSSS
ncbi:hypothetical protein R1sor_020640 [Riccia sorocarpa]|uniref:Nudix hydrolase domain-containing protein n=1 Tax=Riccia sorocarpa TaxID=122646 RepID=A0ABD3GGW1_9MARC